MSVATVTNIRYPEIINRGVCLRGFDLHLALFSTNTGGVWRRSVAVADIALEQLQLSMAREPDHPQL